MSVVLLEFLTDKEAADVLRVSVELVRADAIAGRIPGALCLGGALKPKVRINPNALAQWGCPIPTQTNENATPSAFAGDDEVAFLKGTACTH